MRSSSRRPDSRELSDGARQTKAGGELASEQLPEGCATVRDPFRIAVRRGCVGADGAPAVERGMTYVLRIFEPGRARCR
ncbi:MAG TPA: hypothetical protein H9956_09455 [Candidatus Eisenbergiella pullicola]|nr:hypothetical protein [Candidatus Eisenbergiella pullicola]